MELKDIVSVAGVGGLNKIIGRTKTGLVLESMDEKKKRFATGLQDKVSILEDISMYTTDGDLPLAKVLFKLNEKGDVPDPKEEPAKLRAFLVDAIQLDSERVYDSDIRKLITWFHMLKTDLDFSKLLEDEKKEDDSGTEHAEGEEKVATRVSGSHSNKAPITGRPMPKANSKGAGGSKTTYRPKSI